MPNISELKTNEIKVGVKLTAVKSRIQKIRNGRIVVTTEVTHILEVLEVMTDILMEAELSITDVLEDLNVKSEKLERQIDILARYWVEKEEGDKQIND